MSRHVPVLVEVVTRAWGLDDPRVLPLLRAENQPGRHRRANAVGQRAHAAGWPVESSTLSDARGAQRRALLRLERIDYTPQGRRDRHRRRVAAAAVEVHLDEGDDADPVSIYDE